MQLHLFFQLICGTMSCTAATINEALWLHASLCLRRRVPLASGWYLDAGWRWPSGDPFTAWSPGFPTHHTSWGWHYWGFSILSQAGMHGEIFFFIIIILEAFAHRCQFMSDSQICICYPMCQYWCNISVQMISILLSNIRIMNPYKWVMDSNLYWYISLFVSYRT